MKTFTQTQTAKDPADHVARMNASYAADPRGFTFELVSIDGETKTGRKRYTVRITIADPGAR